MPDATDLALGRMGTAEWVRLVLSYSSARRAMHGASVRAPRRTVPSATSAMMQAAEWWHACPYRFHDLVAASRGGESSERAARGLLLREFASHLETGCAECAVLRAARGDVRDAIARGAHAAIATLDGLHGALDAADGSGVCTWHTGRLTSISGAFRGRWWEGTWDLRLWDTRAVTDMSRAFESCLGRASGLGHWSVGRVETMRRMFAGAASFGQPTRFDTGSLRYMGGMFAPAPTGY